MKVRLGEICTIYASKNPLQDERVWLLNLDMVEQQTGNVIDTVYVNRKELTPSTVAFDEDVVLYSKLRPNLNKVVLPDRKGYATSEMLPLRPNAELSREYLAWFLRSPSFVEYAVGKVAGAKMPRLGTSVLLETRLELPTIIQQKHIANVFFKIANLIDKRKQQLQKLEELVKARFVEMFGTVHNNVYGFDIGTLDSVSDELFAGGDKPDDCILEKDATHRYPVFANGYENEGLQGYSVTCRVTKPAVTVSARGTIGYCFIRNAGFTPVVRLITIVPNNKVSSVFLKYAIDTMDINSSGTSQAQLTVPNFKRERIIVPPMEPQERFTAFVSQVYKSKAAIQSSLDQLETLKKSLMQEYYG